VEFCRATDAVPSPRWELPPRSLLPTSSIELGPYLSLTLAEPQAYLRATPATVRTPSAVDPRRAEVSPPPHRRATSSVIPHPWLLARHVRRSTSVLTPAVVFHLDHRAAGRHRATTPCAVCGDRAGEHAHPRPAPWVGRPLNCRPTRLLWRLDQANSNGPRRPHRFSCRSGSVPPSRTVALGQNQGLFSFRFNKIPRNSSNFQNW
jgi:hypothetical protein